MLDDHDEDNRPLEPGLPPMPSHEPSIPPIPRDALLPGEARGTTEPAPPLSQPEPTIADVLQAIGALRAHFDKREKAIFDRMLELREENRKDVAAAFTLAAGEIKQTREEILAKMNETAAALDRKFDAAAARIEGKVDASDVVMHAARSAIDAATEARKVADAAFEIAKSETPSSYEFSGDDAGQ